MTPTDTILKFCEEFETVKQSLELGSFAQISGSPEAVNYLIKRYHNSSRAIEALREITEALKHYSKYIIDHNEDADTAIDALAKAAKILEGK